MSKKAIVITDQGFEDEEVIYIVIRLYEAGFKIYIATQDKKLVFGRLQFPLENLVKYYATLIDANQLDDKKYDLVVIPGGFEAPDRVRQQQHVLEFIKRMYATKKIVAAICHGPWVLISAGLTKGKKVTSYKGMKDDLINSGAIYLDQAVVIDGNIITSRHPTDMGVFMKTIIKKVSAN